LLLKEKFLFGISAFGIFRNDFASGLLVSGELLVSPLVHSLSLFVLSFSFSFPFLSFFVSLSCHCCCGLLLASSMVESSPLLLELQQKLSLLWVGASTVGS
jgi:hypothetical protein